MISKRLRIDDTTYVTGELQALYYLIQVGKAGLNDIATYCGLKRTTAYTYVAALQRKKLVDNNGTRSSVPGLYWCTDKTKAEALLAKVPVGVIDTDIKVNPPARVVKISRSRKTKINGTWFSLGELSVLNCLVEAENHLTPKEIVAKGNVTTLSQVYTLLDQLSKKQLVDRRGSINQYYYWCKNPNKAKTILGAIDKALIERR